MPNSSKSFTQYLGEVEGLTGELEKLNGQTCTVQMSADNTPLVATIGESNYLLTNYDAKNHSATLTAENGQAIATIDVTTGKILAIPDKNATVTATGVDNGATDVKNTIDNTNSKSVTLTANAQDNGVSGLAALWNSIKSKTVTIWQKIVGKSDVDGTAHVNGTAFRNGTWGVKNSGAALGGELGEELIVRDGQFFTIGSDSAEFFTYRHKRQQRRKANPTY